VVSHLDKNYFMLKKIYILIFVILSNTAYGQVAIIRDKDGFCNIRSDANTTSKVIDTLANDKIIYCFADHNIGEWFPVEYTQNGLLLSGYIHKTRIVFIDKLKSIKTYLANDSTIKSMAESFKLTIAFGNFISSNHLIKYENPKIEDRFVKTVDNKFPWGTDGNIPKKEYKKFQLQIDGQNIVIDKEIYKDLFEPNLRDTKAFFEKISNRYFITTQNSDAAGSYTVVWAFKNYIFQGREIFRGF
jgi:hypothetical protein